MAFKITDRGKCGMNDPDSLQGLCPKATGVNPWYGVHVEKVSYIESIAVI